jgi:hypothetical protein
MPTVDLSDIASKAVVAVEEVGHQLEHVFAEAGVQLGHAHTIFTELNAGLNALSEEMSGSKMEGVSVAFQRIAARLRGLADALPVESSLLGAVGKSAAHASGLLKQLVKHIHLITVIARSSRIEAASLESDRDNFLSFTREASDLARSVQSTIVACAKDQEQLSNAIAEALTGQQQFERRYRDRLLSVSAALASTFAEICHLQAQGGEVARSTKETTLRFGDAVGTAIVSLQAGDSTRQRLEHICAGLRKVVDVQGGLAPRTVALVCVLQGEQLSDAVSEFGADIGIINNSMTRLSTDAGGIVGPGHQLVGGKNNATTSFLSVMKQRLAEASALISACGHAKISVDLSMAALDDVLEQFRVAISALNETVVDITLIGMNASLKAAHLGERGRAFVVIANELKQTADRIAASAKLLEPVLEQIGQAADRLKRGRLEEEPLNVVELERSMAAAIEQIQLGNDRLAELMEQISQESARFEAVVTGAGKTMSDLGGKFAALSRTADCLEAAGPQAAALAPGDGQDTAEFDESYKRYTMETERLVHRKVSDRFGIFRDPSVGALEVSKTDSDDVLFF